MLLSISNITQGFISPKYIPFTFANAAALTSLQQQQMMSQKKRRHDMTIKGMAKHNREVSMNKICMRNTMPRGSHDLCDLDLCPNDLKIY